MFRKSFKIKSNTRLKTTEKKKLRNDLLKEYPGIESFLTLDALNLKSNISLLDITTSSGDNVKVYIAPLYPSFILANGKYFPTVYMLWEIPTLVHNFTTHSPVFDKIKKGADLMLPGVVLDEPVSISSYGSVKKGDVVAVNLVDNLSSIAVGEAPMSSDEMFQSGKRGKCVSIMHCFGDYLSELAPSFIEVPLLKDTCENINLPTSTTQKEDFPSLSQSLQDNVVINEYPPLPASSEETCQPVYLSNTTCDTVLPFNIESTSDPVPDLSMDDLMKYCFFKSLVTSAKKIALPLLTNVFYKVHMMGVYPEGSQLDIKKTKYKKLLTFLEEMAETKVIKLEETTAGVHKITNIDHSHFSIREFVKVNPQENTSNNQKVQTQVQGPSISEKYCINAQVLPLLSKFGYRKGDSVTQADIRKAITSYVKDQDLLDYSDKRFIKPDNLLKSVMKKEVPSLTWEDIMKSITDIMGQSYQVNLPTNKTLSGKGKMPLIEIQVASRAGNKKVTLVNNLTFYGVNLNDFSKECQHGVAASTTINNLPHLKAEQVQIQGNQVNFVGKLLLGKYQIPKRFIRGLT